MSLFIPEDGHVLVIDDRRVPDPTGPLGSLYCQTETDPADGFHALRSQSWDVVFLDHDMGYGVMNGSQLSKLIVLAYKSSQPPKVKNYVIVTNNYVGGAYMYKELKSVQDKFGFNLYSALATRVGLTA